MGKETLDTKKQIVGYSLVIQIMLLMVLLLSFEIQTSKFPPNILLEKKQDLMIYTLWET